MFLGGRGERLCTAAHQEDNFVLKLDDLGKISYIDVSHDNAGLATAWFLDRVEIVDETVRCPRHCGCVGSVIRDWEPSFQTWAHDCCSF